MLSLIFWFVVYGNIVALVLAVLLSPCILVGFIDIWISRLRHRNSAAAS